MIIKRSQYVDRLAMYLNRAELKVLTGMRRSGKTTVLRQFIDYMIEEESIGSEDIFYLDMESMSLAGLTDASVLRTLCLDFVKKSEEKKYIILDEVGSISGWSEVASEMMNLFNASVYVSSSNALIFDGDFMKRFKSRYLKVDVFPLSFPEFEEFSSKAAGKNITIDQDALDGENDTGDGENDAGGDENAPAEDTDASERNKRFLEYLFEGFMPGTRSISEGAAKKDYLKGLYYSAVLQDVIKARKLRDVSHIEKIMEYVLSHIGQSYSPKALRDYIASRGTTISVDTVYSVLDALVDAFILYRVPRFDVKAERVMDTREKYYLCDPAMADALTDRELSLKTRMESALATELLRRGFRLYTAKSGQSLVDFMAVRGSDRTYINIAETVSDPGLANKAFGPLTRIRDNYFKMVLSLDESTIINKGGIINYPLMDFLSEG